MPVLNIMLILLIVFVVILLLILSVRRHIAIKLALEAIAPRDISYGAVLSQKITRNHIDRSLMDLKYDKLFLKNARGQELIARLYLASAQTDHYVLFFARLQLSLGGCAQISADAARTRIQCSCT